MPTLMAFDAALEQEPRALGGRHVAGDDVDAVDALADLGERPLHHQRVAVGDVDDQHVGAGPHHLRRALEIVAGGADRGADPQPALRVARGERVAACA